MGIIRNMEARNLLAVFLRGFKSAVIGLREVSRMNWAKTKQELSSALKFIKKGERTLDNYSGMFRVVLEKRLGSK